MNLSDLTPRTSPVVVLVVGMAGSGKTTLMHRINIALSDRGSRGYFINLDPAVGKVPFAANIDIRDTVNYKEVMSQYNLGPVIIIALLITTHAYAQNGGILTSLNLFSTRFDQVIEILERRVDEVDYIFVDTPGQIEVFTWSAGGQIILELLGSTFPTVVLYVSDTTRCSSPTTFMSNMLYCCSVLYKSRLPMVCAFNKIDAVSCNFALEWMADFEAYLSAVDESSGGEAGGDNDGEYMGSLNRSLALVMDEFYKNIGSVGVSAATGEGMEDLFAKIGEAAAEFTLTYLPLLQSKARQRDASELDRQRRDLAALRQDFLPPPPAARPSEGSDTS